MSKKQPTRSSHSLPGKPSIPTPSIKPKRNAPGFDPVKNPNISTPTSPVVNPRRTTPEIQPNPTPDATPKKPPTEIPPHNDPYSR
jgi:hypothetical protein